MRKGEYHLEVMVWIENDRGEYLISQRSPNKTSPNMWECTGDDSLIVYDYVEPESDFGMEGCRVNNDILPKNKD